jgi:methylmalonyl-CoA mutase N-terminal domain/subunit
MIISEEEMGKKKTSASGHFKKGFLERVESNLKNWEENTLKKRVLDGELRPEFWTKHGQKEKTKPEFKSGSGDYTIKEIYTPLDVNDADPIEQIGLPGSYPYTRGRDPLGFQALKLPLKFYSGYGSIETAKQRYKTLYDGGSRFILVAADLPTQIGYDSDSPVAAGEVGKVGVAFDTLADMERLFDWMPLDKVQTGTVGNCIGPWALSMFYLLGEKGGVDPSIMRVQIQNDPFKEYTGRGTYIFSPKIAVDLASDVVAYVCKYLPNNWEPQYHCTTTLRWGGCSATQEVGFGIANLIAYIEAAQEKDVMPEVFVPRLNLHMTADMDLFEEAAKFRAARRLWAEIARERFKTNDPRITSLRITVYTGANRLIAQQPLSNIVRVTIQVLASMLGGVESITVPAYDEALALPTAESTRLAGLTPHILNDECMAGNTSDPLGGSYYVEWLTNKIEEDGRKWYDAVEAMGGALAAVESGYYLQQMADGMYKYQQEVERGERTIVGLNKFVVETEEPIELFKFDYEAEKKQIERLRKIKLERDHSTVEKCLSRLKQVSENKAAGKQDNIVPPMMEAVKAYATVGEIFDVLREIFGEYRLPLIV